MSPRSASHGTLIVNGVTPSQMQQQIAGRVRARVRASGRTTVAHAAEMGVPRTRVSDWVNGNALLGPIHAARLAQLLDCSPAWLLFGMDEPRQDAGGTSAQVAGSDLEPSGKGRGERDWVEAFFRREAERSRQERPAAGAKSQRATLSDQQNA